MNRQQNKLFNHIMNAANAHIVNEFNEFIVLETQLSSWLVGQQLKALGFSNTRWDEWNQKERVIEGGYYHEEAKMVANIGLSGNITISTVK